MIIPVDRGGEPTRRDRGVNGLVKTQSVPQLRADLCGLTVYAQTRTGPTATAKKTQPVHA